MITKKLLKLVEFLQDNTDLRDYLQGDDSATENNPKGDYALIERWLTEQMDQMDLGDLDALIK